jgi:hypothetical protein
MLAGILRITGSVELKSAIRQEFGGRQLFFHDGLLLRLPPRRFMRTVRLSPYLQESIGIQEPFCASIERLIVACEMARAAEAARRRQSPTIGGNCWRAIRLVRPLNRLTISTTHRVGSLSTSSRHDRDRVNLFAIPSAADPPARKVLGAPRRGT